MMKRQLLRSRAGFYYFRRVELWDLVMDLLMYTLFQRGRPEKDNSGTSIGTASSGTSGKAPPCSAATQAEYITSNMIGASRSAGFVISGHSIGFEFNLSG
jgi:hypothetical protein